MYSKRSSKKLWRVLFGVVLCFVIGTIFLNNSSFAITSDDVVETNFFGNYVEDDEGCGVYMVLDLIIDILSMGVVIAGVIGVTIAGIQYMSAKDSEEKTRKAKNRIFEIVIGLVVYAVLFVGAQWLLPGGMMNQKCRKISNEQLAQMKEDERKEEEERKKKEEEERINKENEEKVKEQRQEEQQKAKDYNRCMERAAKAVRDKVCKFDNPNEKLATSAKILAWPSGTSKNVYYNYATPEYRKAAKETGVPDRVAADTPELHDHYIGKSCAMYVCVSVAASGVDQYFPGGIKSNRACNTEQIYKYLSGSSRWESVSNPKPGDVIVSNGWGHVATYVKKGNRTVIAQGNLHTHFGVVTNSSAKWSGFTVFRYKGK